MKATAKMTEQKLLREKLNHANAAMDHAPITTDEDPRVAITNQINRHMATLTPDERDALLAEWGY